VKKIAEVQVDEKDRPLSPVVISNCGELELRKPPGTLFQILVEVSFNNIIALAMHVQTPESASEERGTTNRSLGRRFRSHSPSSDREHHHRKKSKKKRAPANDEDEKETSKLPIKETEEEYDARLEKEEKERIDEDRKKELERIKQKYESEIQNSKGIRFKGQF
jgi:peptidyl-prolyl isomerase G (cyclophilin G)